MFGLSQIQLVGSLILAAALAASVAYIFILRANIETLTAEKANVITQLTESQANLIQLSNDIAAQNSAIDKLKADADKRVSAGLTEIKRAKESANVYKLRADNLAKRQPPTGSSMCEAANGLFNEEIQNVRK